MVERRTYKTVNSLNLIDCYSGLLFISDSQQRVTRNARKEKYLYQRFITIIGLLQ